MINVNKQVSMYFSYLFHIKKTSINKHPREQDLIWKKFYEDIDEPKYIPKNLPKLLALIHPEFYFCNGTSFVNDLNWLNTYHFSKSITNIDRCQAHRYIGIECIFNKSPNVRGKCHADHIWPNSLGGPSILDNRMILCKYHNGMKSNDIYTFDWQVVPNWLKSYLDKINVLKI